jgi:hypothetical protein
MFKLKDARARSHDETPTSDDVSKGSKPTRLSPWSYLVDACVILAMAAILFWGVSTQFSNQYNDATRYQCYAVAFWQGNAALRTLGLNTNAKSQCAFLDASSSSTLLDKMKARHFPSFLLRLVESQPTTQAFHSLPPEYPLLTLIPFSLPLLTPMLWYQVAFAIFMAITAGILYLVIARYRSRPAAIAFAFYLALGSWATALGRFDLIPAGLTLGAVILAGRSRWNWAYALLALATLLKFYPAILIPIFLIAQQKQMEGKWLSWRRWKGLGVFVGTCALVTLVSLLLNVANTLEPFAYFFNRPIQVESFPGTLLWLGQFAGRPVQYTFVYQSLNFTSSLSNKVSLGSTFLLVVGLLYTFWLQWRGKLDIYTASLLTLLIVVIMGKVFSPQYLMWVTPLIAYVGKSNWKWIVSWGAVAALTTFIFPFMYVAFPSMHIDNFHSQQYLVIVVRDVLVLAIVCALLYRATRTKLVLT